MEALRAKVRLEKYTVAGHPAGFVVELPRAFLDLFGTPEELELRLVKNGAGCSITLTPGGKALYSASEISGLKDGGF
ncbi:MAG: hypothetical protein KGO96_13165 [Elusimicrobia bacterium]|nr:hypothetical protein [Elusimicrobiota bacterium]MDE2426844.1 hypothetical protein [Elusimicrobiota bacterium]